MNGDHAPLSVRLKRRVFRAPGDVFAAFLDNLPFCVSNVCSPLPPLFSFCAFGVVVRGKTPVFIGKRIFLFQPLKDCAPVSATDLNARYVYIRQTDAFYTRVYDWGINFWPRTFLIWIGFPN